MRGFILFFIEKGQDYLDPSQQQMCAALGENEDRVAAEFNRTFADHRQLMGVVSLEEIEHHRSLILQCAAAEGVEIERRPIDKG